MAAGTLLEVEIGADGNFGGAGHASTVQAPFEGRVLVEAAGGGGGADSEEAGGAGYRCRTDTDICKGVYIIYAAGAGAAAPPATRAAGAAPAAGTANSRPSARGAARAAARTSRSSCSLPGAWCRARAGRGSTTGRGAGAGSWSPRAGSHTEGVAAGTGHKPSKTSLLNR